MQFHELFRTTYILRGRTPTQDSHNEIVGSQKPDFVAKTTTFSRKKLVEIIATNDTSNKTLLNTASESLNIIFSEKFGKKTYGC